MKSNADVKSSVVSSGRVFGFLFIGLLAVIVPMVMLAGPSESNGVENDATRSGDKTSIELGLVNWLRDYDFAINEAGKKDKPVMLLFQEVPGCYGCQKYGKEVLSHPLIIEASEELFVPLCIHNNKPGKDAEITKRFNEPVWNYPVVRYIDTKGKDLIPRQDKIYGISHTAARMTAALQKVDMKVPAYLELFAQESSENLKTATFSMACFWTGQSKLGGIDGVVTARAGWLGGAEVVEVRYDPKQVDYDDLLRAATEMRCARKVLTYDKEQDAAARKIVGDRAERLTGKVRPIANTDAHQYRHLRNSSLLHLPMTESQATKVNAALSVNADPAKLLSPRQIAQLAQINAAIASGNGKAFKGMVFPEDPAALAGYAKQLEEKLK